MDAVVVQSHKALHHGPPHDHSRSLPVAVPQTRLPSSNQVFSQTDFWGTSLSQSIPLSEDTELGSDVSGVPGVRSAQSSMATTPDNNHSVASRLFHPSHLPFHHHPPLPLHSLPNNSTSGPQPSSSHIPLHLSHSLRSAPSFQNRPPSYKSQPLGRSSLPPLRPHLRPPHSLPHPPPGPPSLPPQPVSTLPQSFPKLDYGTSLRNQAGALFRPPPSPLLSNLTQGSGSRSVIKTINETQVISKNIGTSLATLSDPPMTIPLKRSNSVDSLSEKAKEYMPETWRGPMLRSRPSTRFPPYSADTHPSDSESSSEFDLYTYRNARYFPPRHPATSGLIQEGVDHGSSATQRITSWVAEHESAQGDWNKIRAKTEHDSQPDESSTEGSNTSVSESWPHESEDYIQSLWARLKSKRVEIGDMRSKMAKMRKTMQDVRSRKNDADNGFMRFIRPLWIKRQGSLDTFPDALEKRLTEMQDLRTEYYSLEIEYERLENHLGQEEDALGGLEVSFFSLLASGHAKPGRPKPRRLDWRPGTTEREKPLMLQGISPDGPPEDLHPLYMNLMSNVGALENAKEEYQDLIALRDQHEIDVKLRQITMAPLTWPEQEFMEEFTAEFPAEQDRMRKEIERLQREVKDLLKRCEDKGVMRKHLSAKTSYLLYPEREYEEDMELESCESILQTWEDRELSIFPLLRSQPGKAVFKAGPQTPLGALKVAVGLPNSDPEKESRLWMAQKEYAIDQLISSREIHSKVNQINRWLLHKLRLSSLEVILLYLVFINSQGLQIRDQIRWETDVLRFWWADSKTPSEEDEEGSIELGGQGNDTMHESRIGTPQPSRAASEAVMGFERWFSQGSPRDVSQARSV